MPENTTIGENSWIKLTVRSAIAVVVAIAVGTATLVLGYFGFKQEAGDLSQQLASTKQQFKEAEAQFKRSSSNFWTVTDMNSYGREQKANNWSLVRENDSTAHGLIIPDAREIHRDNQL